MGGCEPGMGWFFGLGLVMLGRLGGDSHALCSTLTCACTIFKRKKERKERKATTASMSLGADWKKC